MFTNLALFTTIIITFVAAVVNMHAKDRSTTASVSECRHFFCLSTNLSVIANSGIATNQNFTRSNHTSTTIDRIIITSCRNVQRR